jgi:REP element-mobilizing transposase RayT
MQTQAQALIASAKKPVPEERRPSRPLRIEEVGGFWFITTRTIEERFWLHPILSSGLTRLNRKGRTFAKSLERLYHRRVVKMVQAANRRMGPHQPRLTVEVAKRMLKDLVGSALARAQEHSREQGAEVQVFAFVAMSNHVHLVVRTAGKNLASFMGYFKARVAEGINYLTGRRGPLFARRYDAQSIRNLNAAAERIAYTVDNPRKAKLVAHHDDWPGQLLCYGLGDTDQPTFEYLARTDWHRDRRRKGIDEYFATATLTLSPLPQLTYLERDEYARMVEGWIGELEQEATDQQRKGPKPKTTERDIEKLLDVPFEHRPAHAAFKKRPYAFGTPEEKRQYYGACCAKYARHRGTSLLFRTIDRTVAFPEGMYPPPLLQAA